jgi:hypothetical protein
VSSRHERRRFRREATSSALVTYLCEPTDPALDGLLKATANCWLDLLAVRVRHCIICSSWIVDRKCVGLLLLATPATAKPTSASACAICRDCVDLPLEAIERAATTALQEALPGGRFKPHPADARR